MASPVRIYAGTQEGLLICRSRNGSWEKVSLAFETGTIDAIDGLRSQPNIVYLGVTQDGLYRTDDAGKSWRRVFEGNVRAVTVDPTDEQVIYVGVEPIHLYRSEDSGGSWQELTGVQALPAEVKKNWTFPRPPHREHVRHIFIHPEEPSFLLVCLEHGGIIRSFDRGKTWQDVSRGIDYLDIHHISSAPGRKDLFFVASARGFFKSSDPGNGWQRAESGFTRDYFHDFVFLPGNPGAMLVATADKSPGYWDRPERAQGALFRSRNLAESWERVGVGKWLPQDMTQMVWALAQHPEDPSIVYAGLGAVSRGRSADASQKGAGDILVSEDQGDSWERLPIDLPADRVLWIAADS
ncbi:MAG: WD40/YVTN/BNR-like repeat-containing protein [Candidatus Binatia bacterium]